MYAVEFFLDSNTETFVRNIWGDLKSNGITSNMPDIDEIRPHISVAVYKSELQIDQFLKHFDLITKKMHQIEVQFYAVATFPSSGTVFIPPTITSDLIESHRQFHTDLEEYESFGLEYYMPQRWNPHCTFAIQLDKNTLLKTLELCLNQFEPIKGKIEEIGVVKLEFDNNKCVSSKTIFSSVLR
jgi:hypothetical protein